MPLTVRLIVAAVLAACFCGCLGGCGMPSFLITPVGNTSEIEEIVADPGKTRKEKIALIEVEGMLANTRATSGGILGGGGENKVSLLKQQLDAAAADKRVKGVVLRINSPGGTVAASDTMFDLVAHFRETTGKPVVAYCQDVAASGGYYVACAADEIHASEASVIGSIGVIFQTLDFSGLMDKVGVRVVPLKSGPLKDMGSPYDGLDDAERAVMQGMVDEMYASFVDVVDAARGDRVDRSLAYDGRVFTGTQAMEVGLLDRLCGLEESIDRARRLARAPGAAVIQYKRPYGYSGSIYASAPVGQPRDGDAGERLSVQLPGVDRVTQMLQPGMYYLWMP